jgi:hypothetical protein
MELRSDGEPTFAARGGVVHPKAQPNGAPASGTPATGRNAPFERHGPKRIAQKALTERWLSGDCVHLTWPSYSLPCVMAVTSSSSGATNSAVPMYELGVECTPSICSRNMTRKPVPSYPCLYSRGCPKRFIETHQSRLQLLCWSHASHSTADGLEKLLGVGSLDSKTFRLNSGKAENEVHQKERSSASPLP